MAGYGLGAKEVAGFSDPWRRACHDLAGILLLAVVDVPAGCHVRKVIR